MQYDTIEELTLELALYPNKKIDILEDCAGECKYGWFTVAKDGNCALFDENGDLDDINKVKSINDTMILKDIEKIIIPNGVTSITWHTFSNCIDLMSVTIPNSVKYIGDFAFAYCSSLTSITIPDSVKSIEKYAFRGCSSLTSVTIPDSVTSIDDQVFQHCGLTSVDIPDSVTSIGFESFADCCNLTNVTIPANVTSIGGWAFAYCINLNSITFARKTIEEVQSMKHYPFGIKDKSIIRCEG